MANEKTDESERETEDVQTEDVVEAADDTISDAERKKSARRVRMPTKEEIMKAVDQVETDSLDVDPLTKESAQTPKVTDVD